MQVRGRLLGGGEAVVLASAALVLGGGAASASPASGPAASGPAATAGRPGPAVGRMLRAPGTTERTISGTTQLESANWSGYAQDDSNGTYKAVEDTWKVPTVTKVAGTSTPPTGSASAASATAVSSRPEPRPTTSAAR
jgi:hypothetical protein